MTHFLDNNKLYKHAPKGFLHNFLNLLNVCWNFGDIPEEWSTAIVIPIHKKEDRNNPDNYRGISLLNTGYEIHSKIIAKRLTAITRVLLLEEQNGFRKGRSCMDCIFSASQIIEKHLTSPHVLCSLILKKPFDSVDRDKLWTIMLSKGIPTHLITKIQKIYKENIIRVNAGNGISEDSRAISQGVRQGCPLSSVLLDLYLGEVIRICLQKIKLVNILKI